MSTSFCAGEAKGYMRVIKFVAAIAFVLVPFSSVLSGCSKDNNIDQSNTTTNTYQQTIGTNGGLVGDIEGQGVGVYVPGGALLKPTTIAIRSAQADEYPAELPQGYSAAGAVYAFEPHDVEFAAAVTMHLPKPEGIQYGSVLFAKPGGAWQPLESSASFTGRTVTFSSMHFSYYMVAKVNGPGSQTPPDTNPNTGGTSGSGGTGGTGGPGSGASSGTPSTPTDPREETCEPVPSDAVSGWTDAKGTIGGVGLTALDGFAVVRKESMTDRHTLELSLVFADYEQACGYAEAGKQVIHSENVHNGGKKNSKLFIVSAHEESTQPLEVTAKTYTEVRAALNTMNAECMEDMRPTVDPSNSITITQVTSTNVTGTVTITSSKDGTTFQGAFDLPFCQVAAAEPTGPGCCLP